MLATVAVAPPVEPPLLPLVLLVNFTWILGLQLALGVGEAGKERAMASRGDRPYFALALCSRFG